MKNFRFLEPIAMIFVSILLISNVASTKIVDFGMFDFDGGTLLFPLSYIFGDILTEVYGYGRTRRIIWIGFLMNIVMVLVFSAVGALPASESWNNQDAYNSILGMTPRIVLASMVAYTFGAFSNSYVLAKLKLKTKGKFLWLRTIGSTIVGEGLDTVIFCLISFYGVLPNELLGLVILSNYIFKVGIEVIFTPVTYLIVNALKRLEGVDVYDRKTLFNPFRINSDL